MEWEQTFVGLLVKWIGNLVSRLILCGKEEISSKLEADSKVENTELEG